jgi:hypothetical protein
LGYRDSRNLGPLRQLLLQVFRWYGSGLSLFPSQVPDLFQWSPSQRTRILLSVCPLTLMPVRPKQKAHSTTRPMRSRRYWHQNPSQNHLLWCHPAHWTQTYPSPSGVMMLRAYWTSLKSENRNQSCSRPKPQKNYLVPGPGTMRSHLRLMLRMKIGLVRGHLAEGRLHAMRRTEHDPNPVRLDE